MTSAQLWCLKLLLCRKVMLENRKQTLPLSAAGLRGKKVALVGPCANNTNCHIGDYSAPSNTPPPAFLTRS